MTIPGSQHDSPATSPGFLLWRCTLGWQREITAALRPLGLTHGQFVILASIRWLEKHAPDLPNQRQVADHAGTDPMMTSELVRALERLELIGRRRSPSDGRAFQISTTQAGRALASDAIVAVEAADEAFFSAVDTAAAVDVLRRLTEGTRPLEGRLSSDEPFR